jgi:hypothetical protein
MTPIDLSTHKFVDYDVLELVRGQTYTVPAPILISAQHVTIKATDGTGPLPVVLYSYTPTTAGTQTAAFTFAKTSNYATIQDIEFRPTGPGNHALWFNGGTGHHVLRTYIPTGCYGFMQATGVTEFTASDNTADIIQNYWLQIFGDPNNPGTLVNANVTLSGNRVLGSSYQDIIRLDSINGLTLLRNVLFNRAWLHDAVNILSGQGLIFRNNFIYGPLSLGPSNGADGGLNEPNPVLKAAKLNQRWDTADISSNTIRGDWQFRPGAINITLQLNCFKHPDEETSGYAMWCPGTYGSRPAPSGVAQDNTATYPTGQFINTALPLAYENLGNVFNGTPIGSSSPQAMDLGINLESIRDYDRSYAFINRIKHVRKFGTPGSPFDKACPVDALGNPQADFGCFWDRQINMNGTYKFSCTPTGANPTVVAVQNCTVSNVVLSGGVLSADIVINQPADTEFALAFKVTGTTSGATNIKMLCPGYADDTAIFTSQFLTFVSKFDKIRFMDWMQTNTSTVTTWASRRQVQAAYYTEAPGVPVEICIALANAVGKNLWINIPTDATADYIQGLKACIESSLKPGLIVNVEYSNEVWNGIFRQFQISVNSAQAEIAAGDTQLNDKGAITNKYYLAQRWVGKKLMWVRSILGTTAQYRYILAGQLVVPWTAQKPLDYITSYHGQPKDILWAISPALYFSCGKDSVKGTDIPGHYIAGSYDADAVAASPNSSFNVAWMAKTDAVTAADIITRISSRTNVAGGTFLQQWKDMGQTAGVKVEAYEGGLDFEQFNCNVAAKTAADTGTDIQNVIKNYINNCQASGIAGLMYFSSTGAISFQSYWELTTDARDLNQPKLLGLLDAKTD